MNDKKIAFIICTNNEMWFQECVFYLQNLELPEQFDIEVIQITDAKSMAAGYNEGMHSSDAKYKIYMHHDTFIIRKDFLVRVIKAFTEHPEVGIMGVFGTDKVLKDAVFWKDWDLGQVYALDTRRNYCLCDEDERRDEVVKAVAVDGMILMTQYDVEWREDIFNGWDFYDISQCFEFRRRGYEVAVLREKEISCLHDCGYSKLDYYDVGRKIFCKEYAEYGFIYEECNIDRQLELRREILRKSKEGLNSLLLVDRDKARELIDDIIEYFMVENNVVTLKMVFDIYAYEKESYGEGYLVQIGDTWDSLIEKFIKYKFLVRRVEFDICKEALEEVAIGLQLNDITLCALAKIVEHYSYNKVCVVNKINSLFEKQ